MCPIRGRDTPAETRPDRPATESRGDTARPISHPRYDEVLDRNSPPARVAPRAAGRTRRQTAVSRASRKPPEVRPFDDCLHEQMHVIGHDAVRKYRELFERRCLPKMVQRLRNEVPVGKDPTAAPNAECEEVLRESDIGDRLETFRARHDAQRDRKEETGHRRAERPRPTPPGPGNQSGAVGFRCETRRSARGEQ